ncbi:GLEYA domain-containing protein [Xylariaceae sp. AK1471]|nr:GLEYA domain-containing protein [Xylariaceae sp. AK1471]
MRSSTSLALLLPVAVSAVPTSKSGNGLINELFCDVNVIVIAALQKDAQATSYCSSYLSYPTSTETVTVTKTPTSVYTTVPVTVTGDAVTETTTITSTTATDITTIETATVTVTQKTTQITATTTLTCLNSAYTASAPVATIGKRYGGDQQLPKPTYIPSSWSSPAISSACVCLSIPTPCVTTTVTKTLVPGTITVTSTNTLTPTAIVTDTATYTETSTHTESTTTTTTTTLTAFAEATTIASSGLMYRKYTHPYDANLVASGFTSSAFKSLTPDWRGVIHALTFDDYTTGGVYLTIEGHAAFDATQAAILAQGFFLAKETGTYTLTSSKDTIDNWGYLWTGDVAYSAWDDSNTAYQSSRTGAPYVTGTTTLTLNAGDAIPLTWLFANGGGPAQSVFTIITPSGASTSDTTSYFVQACSASIFP